MLLLLPFFRNYLELFNSTYFKVYRKRKQILIPPFYRLFYNHPCRKFINSYRAPIVQFMIPGKSDIDINQERKGLRKKEGEKKTRFISREEDEKGDGEEYRYPFFLDPSQLSSSPFEYRA